MPRARIAAADKPRRRLSSLAWHGIWRFRGTAWAIVRRTGDRNGVVAVARGGCRRAFVDNEVRDALVLIVEETHTIAQSFASRSL